MGDMLSITQLEVFLRVIEEGGFSGAAKTLYLSQPAVSHHVRNLETSLGIALVVRGPHGARPTPGGIVIAEHARDVLALITKLELAAANFRGLEAGRLTIAATTTPARYLLPQLMTRFANKAPRVTCEIRSGNEDTVEAWVLRGEVSLGVCVETQTTEPLIAERLFDETMLLVAPAGHRLAGRPLAPAELADERFLLREVGSATRRLQDQALSAWALPNASTWDLWGADTLKEAVQQGLGIAILPEHATRRELDHAQLALLDVDPAPPTRTISLVRRADRPLTPPEQAFVELVRSVKSWPAPARPGDAADRDGPPT